LLGASRGVVRRPAVAGYFYPAEAAALRAELDALTPQASPRLAARAVVLPHGSVRQCGAIVAATLARVQVPPRCIILGPSHTGNPVAWSLLDRAAYRTPLGDVPVDGRCAEALKARCAFLEPDPWAQAGEHAIEVLLPWLQRSAPPELSIVPIIVGAARDQEIGALAEALAQVVRMQEEPVLLIASSDLSHYQRQAEAEAQDRALLDAIRTRQGAALIRRVRASSVIMCGYEAVACALDAASLLGATQVAVAAYGTSATAGGDPDSVTGYAGVVIS
jgi:hypothetical protein